MCVYSPWANTVWVWVTAERKQSRVYTHACFFFLSFPFFSALSFIWITSPARSWLWKAPDLLREKAANIAESLRDEKGWCRDSRLRRVYREAQLCAQCFLAEPWEGGLIKHISQTHTLKEILPVSLTQMGVKFSLWIMNCVGAEGEKHWNHLNLIHHAYTNTCTVSYSNGLPLKG